MILPFKIDKLSCSRDNGLGFCWILKGIILGGMDGHKEFA